MTNTEPSARVAISVLEHHERSVELRAGLVDVLKRKGVLRSRAVEDAFYNVPRELFAPEVETIQGSEAVYQDDSLVTKAVSGQVVSTSSQPSIMAEMLQLLDLHGGEKVLEIGTGTGYNAALLANLIGPTGRIVSVEIDPDLATQARKNLQTLNFDDRVLVVAADGWEGYPSEAPYDRIVFTAQADDIKPAWVHQLKEDGLLVLPILLSPDGLSPAVVGFRRKGNILESFEVTGGTFLGMQGQHTVLSQGPMSSHIVVIFEDEQGKQIVVKVRSHLLSHVTPPHRANLLAAWLAGGQVVPLTEEIPSMLNFARYIRLRHGQSDLCEIWCDSADPTGGLGPNRLGGIGLVALESSSPSLALLTWPTGKWNWDNPSNSALLVGPHAASLLSTLEGYFREWKELGFVSLQDLEITAYQGTPALEPTAGAWIAQLRSTTLVLRWGRSEA